jgi:hypothetical protein
MGSLKSMNSWRCRSHRSEFDPFDGFSADAPELRAHCRLAFHFRIIEIDEFKEARLTSFWKWNDRDAAY